MAFEKTNPFIYLIFQNVYLFISCPMIFWYPFIAVSCTNSAPAIPMQRGRPLLLPSPAAPLPFWSYPLLYFNSRHKTLRFAENFMNIGQNLKSYQCVKVSFMCILGWGIYCRIMGLVIDKPWLLSRFWVYCKLYHSLVTFHCLTPNEAEPSLGQTVKGHQIMI